MDDTITPTADNSPQVRQAADDLRVAAAEKAKDFKQTAVDKAQQFREFAGTKAANMKDTARVKAQNVKQVASEQVHNSKAKAKEIHSETEQYIRANPTKSVLTAVGVGFLLGLIVRR